MLLLELFVVPVFLDEIAVVDEVVLLEDHDFEYPFVHLNIYRHILIIIKIIDKDGIQQSTA